MSFATRCTACGTIFRIVEDQLRVSDGWVRCGRCAEVFDARELLFDIERDAPPAWPPAFTPGVAAPTPAPLPVESFEPPRHDPLHDAPAPVAAAPVPEPMARPSTAAQFHEPEFAPGPSDRPPPSDGDRVEPRWNDDPEPPPEPVPSPEPRAPALAVIGDDPPGQSSASVSPSLTSAEPEFLRQATTGQRWQQPRVRVALGGVAAALLTSLAVQAAVHFRDAIVAVHPPARPVLQAVCTVVGCEIKPWQRADVLGIEATALTQVGSRQAYRLNLSLRNKSAVDVAMPWIELSLSDAAGAVLARRVLPATALNPSLTVLPADSEQSLQFSFSTGNHRVSGYTVDVFHP